MSVDGEPKPWDPHPLPVMGDSDPASIFTAVGRALTEWNSFESHLSLLFAHFIALDAESIAAKRAFGAVRTFEARLDMLRAVAEAYFAHFPNDTISRRLYNLVKTEWRNFGARRNEIAHGLVQPWLWRVEAIGSDKTTYCLVPMYFDFKKTDLSNRPKYAYTSEAILSYAQAFADLRSFPLEIATAIIVRGRANPGMQG